MGFFFWTKEKAADLTDEIELLRKQFQQQQDDKLLSACRKERHKLYFLGSNGKIGECALTCKHGKECLQKEAGHVVK